MVYIQALPTMLAIFQSLDVYYKSLENQEKFVYEWSRNGFFWVALIISVTTFLIIVVLLTLHYCKWYPEYNAVAERNKKPIFDRTRWRNT
jgi:hypothetical protein